jgi:excisionase family DNA binding protein
MNQRELTMSVPEAGRRLGLGKNLSYEAVRRGELPALRFGRKLRVPVVALERLLNEGRPKEPTDTGLVSQDASRGTKHP